MKIYGNETREELEELFFLWLEKCPVSYFIEQGSEIDLDYGSENAIHCGFYIKKKINNK